jgi:hypothetical protein
MLDAAAELARLTASVTLFFSTNSVILAFRPATSPLFLIALFHCAYRDTNAPFGSAIITYLSFLNFL